MTRIILFFTLIMSSLQLKAEVNNCQEISRKLGQLFHVSVDGFGTDHIIHPYYFKMVKKIQPGGILPRWQHPTEPGGRTPYTLRGDEWQTYKDINRRLADGLHVTPFLGRDYIESDISGYISPGYGLLSNNENPCDAVVEHGEIFESLGLNQILGPIVEKAYEGKSIEEKKRYLLSYIDGFTNRDATLVLKHFPYTLQSEFDLHKESHDVPVPLEDEELQELFSYYRDRGNEVGVVMTSHLFNSAVDSENLVTFSSRWVEILRKDIGFEGIILADALDMVDDYQKDQVRIGNPSFGYDHDEVHELAHYGIQSIMSGHDMIMFQTSAHITERIFNDMKEIACGDKEVSKSFRIRINDSYARILKVKKQQGLISSKHL